MSDKQSAAIVFDSSLSYTDSDTKLRRTSQKMTDKPLIVSRKSWHFRLLNSVYGEIPKTLCGYFWSVVLAPLAILGSAIVIVLEGIAGPLVRWVASLGKTTNMILATATIASGLTAWGMLNWVALLITIGVLVGVLLGAIVLGILIALFLEHREKKAPTQTASTGKLLWATVVAKKRKICPLIQVQ